MSQTNQTNSQPTNNINLFQDRLGSNYSTQANLSSENDLKFTDMLYGDNIIDDIEEEKVEEYQIEDVGDEVDRVDDVNQSQRSREDDGGSDLQFKREKQQNQGIIQNGYKNDEIKQDHQQKMDIVQFDQNGRQICNTSLVIPHINTQNIHQNNQQSFINHQNNQNTTKQYDVDRSVHKSSKWSKQNHKSINSTYKSIQSQNQNNNVNEINGPIIRQINHVSTHTDLQRTGKAKKKYQGNQNIFKGVTSYKKVDIKVQNDIQVVDKKTIKNRNNRSIIKSTKKRDNINKKVQQGRKDVISRSPHRNLSKQLDPTAMSTTLGSKYTWVLYDNQKNPKKNNSIKKSYNNKNKQVYQKRTSLRLNQHIQQGNNQVNNSFIDSSRLNNSVEQDTQSIFIGKQSLRSRKNKITQKDTKISKNKVSKSTKKSLKSKNKQILKQQKKPSLQKKSASKYSHSKRKYQYQQQIDINYIKIHIKQLDIRNLNLQSTLEPLTYQDRLITQFLLEQKRQECNLKSRRVMRQEQIKREEEVKIEVDNQVYLMRLVEFVQDRPVEERQQQQTQQQKRQQKQSIVYQDRQQRRQQLSNNNQYHQLKDHLTQDQIQQAQRRRLNDRLIQANPSQQQYLDANYNKYQPQIQFHQHNDNTRQLTIEQSFSKARSKRPSKPQNQQSMNKQNKQNRQKQLTLQQSFQKSLSKRSNPSAQIQIRISKVIDPNINNHGIYALFALSQRTYRLTKARYALVPITNLSRAKKRHIQEDYQKARSMVEEEERDNIAYVAVTMNILDLIEEETKRRSGHNNN